jgi:hypothetical protein
LYDDTIPQQVLEKNKKRYSSTSSRGISKYSRKVRRGTRIPPQGESEVLIGEE